MHKSKSILITCVFIAFTSCKEEHPPTTPIENTQNPSKVIAIAKEHTSQSIHLTTQQIIKPFIIIKNTQDKLAKRVDNIKILTIKTPIDKIDREHNMKLHDELMPYLTAAAFISCKTHDYKIAHQLIDINDIPGGKLKGMKTHCKEIYEKQKEDTFNNILEDILSKNDLIEFKAHFDLM